MQVILVSGKFLYTSTIRINRDKGDKEQELLLHPLGLGTLLLRLRTLTVEWKALYVIILLLRTSSAKALSSFLAHGPCGQQPSWLVFLLHLFISDAILTAPDSVQQLYQSAMSSDHLLAGLLRGPSLPILSSPVGCLRSCRCARIISARSASSSLLLCSVLLQPVPMTFVLPTSDGLSCWY